MPPKTKKVVKVVRKLVPKSKTPAAATSAPSTAALSPPLSTASPSTAAVSPPPITASATSPPITAAAAATPPSTAAVTPPPSSTAVTPPPSTAAVTPPPSTAAVTPPPSTAAVTPPPSTAAATPPPITAAATPPPSTAAVTPPPSTTAVTPPPSTAAVTPPPSTAAVSQLPSASAVSPTSSTAPISPSRSAAAERAAPVTVATTLTPPIVTASPKDTPNVPEPDASETPTAGEPAATPAPSETSAVKPAAKPTRIVKKIVKKVVVKRVPKSSVAAKADEMAVVSPAKADEMAVVSPPAAEQKPTPKAAAADAVVGVEALSEGRRRRKTEIFVGGLDRSAKEEDVRKVFGRVGEIMEVRMMMDGKTGKNKGFAFVRYADAAQAKKAVSELAKVEVCGKRCGAAALEGNDTIFLGNIDKKWKKEDVAKLLEESGIEKIDTLTLMADPNNTELNRGFAFLELETNRDAQLAYKKLQRKDAFGKGRNVKVSWAEPLNDPDEEEMQKVKSVYAEGIPSSWNEDKVREAFKKFGDIERVVLARNIQSAKRKDFAFVNYTTREAALSCIESFEKETLTDNGSKINVHVSLAKPVQKDKQIRGGSKPLNKEKVKDKPKAVEYNTKGDTSLNQGRPPRGGYTTNYGDQTSSTTSELLHVLREQASWKPEQISYVGGSSLQDYTHAYPGSKRPYSLLEDAPQPDLRGYPRSRLESSFPVTTSSSYAALSHELPGSSLSYQQRYGAGYGSGSPYQSSTFQRGGQSGSSYRGNYHY